MAKAKIDQPPENWDRLFANVGQLGHDHDGGCRRPGQCATFATCVRCMHVPVQISFTADLTRHTYQNISRPRIRRQSRAFEREILKRPASSD